MKTEACREWRESLGAYALGHLPDEERASLEAHLESCAECRAEAESLLAISGLLPHADPAHFGPAPAPPPQLSGRIVATIGAERRVRRRRRRVRLGLGGAVAVAAAAAALAFFAFSNEETGGPAQRVAFRALPPGVKIAATLEPRAFGTEIHMYVTGVPSGTLCHVYMRGRGRAEVSAGTFRYRWGGEDSAVLSAALDLSRARALIVDAGERTFVAPLSRGEAALHDRHNEEEST